MIKKTIILHLLVLLACCLYSCEKSYTVSDEINSLSFDVLSYSEANNVFKELEERELKYEIIKNLLTIVDKIAPESENFVISPLSLYLSLEMLYEIGDEQVKKEINEFVHINEEIVKETSKLILALSNVNSNFNISNSVWIEKSSLINEQKVKELGNKLLVECFSTDFLNNSAKASKDIGNYLYNKTNGMINNSYLFDSLTAIVLANTMYLKEKWNKKGELETKKLDFKGLTNTINTEFLQGTIERGKIGETDNSRFFYIKLKNNFKLTLFIPKGDNTLFDIMDANNLYAISLYDYIQTDGKYTYGSSLLFPSFKVDTKNDLLEYFEKNNLLTNTRSVFKSSICENDFKISNILHDVYFKVNKKGIEGASSTVIRGATSSGLPEKLETLLIDQPFGFILSYDDYILFAGQIVDIK